MGYQKKHKDVYQEITDKVLEQMEQGERPWSPRWAKGPQLLPQRATGEPYQGINVVNLWVAAQRNYYASPRWLTFNQAKKGGGHIRKGETGTSVVYWKTLTSQVVKETEDEEDLKTRSIPFMRTYTVFNANQIEGLPVEPLAEALMQNREERIPQVDAFFKATGAEIVHRGNQALYRTNQDLIAMPPFETFIDADAYYSTLCHETIHWTGHRTRMDRFTGTDSEEDRAREELVAELGAAFLNAHLGLRSEPRADHAAYLKHWLTLLREDKKAIFKAASAAQKAVGFLLNR